MTVRNALAALATFVLATLFALASCTPGAPQLMPKETLFSLELGTLEDQIDLFQRPGLASPERSRFLFSDGLVLVSDGNARKVMELSSYGDLLSLYYNPDANPVPALAGTGPGGGQVKNRRAFGYPFAELGELALSDNNQLYVEDLVPSERRVFDPTLGAVLESRILRFDRDGKFLDFLGQEGIGGTPFPLVDRLTVTSHGELAVLCRTGSGWAAWWYDRAGNPVDKAVITFDSLPKAPNLADPASLLSQLETVFPTSDRKLLLKVDYYRQLLDPTSHSASGIQSAQSRIWTYDLASRSYQRSYALPVLKRLKSKDDPDPTGDRPYEFLGVSEGGLGFFLSSPEAGNRRFLVCRSDGSPVLERNIASDGSDALFAQYQVTRSGILVGFLSDGNGAQVVWWRTDKLLGTNAVTNF